MQHELYNSIDEMLAPNCLTELVGADIRTVRLRPLSNREGVSGNQLLAVEADNNARFILKRMSLERDWIMRASNDHQCRSVTLWQTGVLDQLQPELSHAIIGCARDDNGWAILMHDVSAGLLPWDRQIDAMAQRLEIERRRPGIVHQDRSPAASIVVAMGGFDDGGDVLNLEGEGAGALAEHRPRVGPQMRPDVIAGRVIAGDDAQPLEHPVAEIARRFITTVDHQKMIARAAHRQDRQAYRLDAGGDADGPGRAFQAGDRILEAAGGGGAAAAIGVRLVVGLQRLQAGIENGGGTIDRRVHGAEMGVAHAALGNGAGVELVYFRHR